MDYGLRRWAREAPTKHALEFESRPAVSYGELELMANRFANLFHALGLQRGDHVSGILANGPEVIAAVWGAYRSGLYYTPVPHTLAPVELAYVLSNSEAKLVIADARFRDKLGEIDRACPDLKFRLAHGEIPGWQDLAEALAAQPATPRPGENPGSIMLYSSGTTGAPKGIWRPLPTAEQVGDGPPPFARDVSEIFGFTSDMRYLSPAPMYHAAPLRWSLSVTAMGGTAVVMDRFDAERALDILETREITVSQWVPTMFHRMLNLPAERRARHHAPLHRAAWHAAAPCSVPLKRAMLDWWGPMIHEYYSGSESVGMTRVMADEWLARPGTVGRAVKGKLHILDEADNEVPAGTPGGVYFDPASHFAYFNDPEKTAAKTSKQGWQTVGEIGFVDEEGWLFLTDRQDDMIISGGVNIYPQEIETAIEELADVSECAVAPLPDADFGERPVAFIVPRNGVDSAALLERVAAHCAARLGRTKQPYRLRLTAELPRSEAGQLLRRVLRAQLAQEAG